MDAVKHCVVCHQPVNTGKVYDLKNNEVLHPACVPHYVYQAMKKSNGSDQV
mgnify:FL=1|tara:strand:- start:347 stop:499 length:153 start_codon:yes stop_codon:yes gene_type:complete